MTDEQMLYLVRMIVFVVLFAPMLWYMVGANTFLGIYTFILAIAGVRSIAFAIAKMVIK